MSLRSELEKLRNNCTPERRQKCAQASGPHLEAICQQCDAFAPYEPTPWFQHIFFLYQLQNGGYPFGQNDLTLEEWIAVGTLKNELKIPGLDG